MVTGRHLITYREAAEMLKLNRTTLSRYVSQGKLSVYRYSSRAVRFDRRDIDAFLASHREEQRPAYPDVPERIRRLYDQRKRA